MLSDLLSAFIVGEVQPNLRRQIQPYFATQNAPHGDVLLGVHLNACGHITLAALALNAEDFPGIGMEKCHVCSIGEGKANLSTGFAYRLLNPILLSMFCRLPCGYDLAPDGTIPLCSLCSQIGFSGVFDEYAAIHANGRADRLRCPGTGIRSE